MKASKPVVSILFLFILVALTPIAAYARGGLTVGSLVFTETSSTVLTAKLGGVTTVGTVSTLGQDSWEWDSGVVDSNPGVSPVTLFWQEPGKWTFAQNEGPILEGAR